MQIYRLLNFNWLRNRRKPHSRLQIVILLHVSHHCYIVKFTNQCKWIYWQLQMIAHREPPWHQHYLYTNFSLHSSRTTINYHTTISHRSRKYQPHSQNLEANEILWWRSFDLRTALPFDLEASRSVIWQKYRFKYV